MKRFFLVLILLSLFAFSSFAATLPSDLELQVTFSDFKIRTDENSSWISLTTSSDVVNILSSAAKSTSGSSITITPPPAGSYSQIGFTVSSIKFVQGTNEREILPILKAKSGGNEDFSEIVENIKPIIYSGGKLLFNAHMSASDISGTTFATYFPDNPPLFHFTGENVVVDTSKIGTITANIASGVTAGKKVELGAFASFQQQAGPSFVSTMTNNGDGTATGTMQLKPGTWYFMAIEFITEQSGHSPPQIGDKGYTAGGAEPWDGTISPVTVVAQETVTTSLSPAFTISALEGGDGGAQTPKGGGSVDFTASVSTPITLSSSTPLIADAYSSLASYSAGGPPMLTLGVNQADAGSFSSLSINSSGLPSGSFIAVFLLDVDGNGVLSSGDYYGAYGAGGVASPTTITVADGTTTQDLTGTEVSLNLYSGN